MWPLWTLPVEIFIIIIFILSLFLKRWVVGQSLWPVCSFPYPSGGGYPQEDVVHLVYLVHPGHILRTRTGFASP